MIKRYDVFCGIMACETTEIYVDALFFNLIKTKTTAIPSCGFTIYVF